MWRSRLSVDLLELSPIDGGGAQDFPITAEETLIVALTLLSVTMVLRGILEGGRV